MRNTTIMLLIVLISACDPSEPGTDLQVDSETGFDESPPLDAAIELAPLPAPESETVECSPGGCCLIGSVLSPCVKADGPASCSSGTYKACQPGTCFTPSDNGLCLYAIDFQGKCCS